MPSEKIAITLEASVLARVEALRRKTRESRSALIARAVRMLLEDELRRDRVAEYVAAYRRSPETTAEVGAADAVAVATASDLAWDDE
jgi:metal-responsive CopG/Arc/MetJ family transcriptional regulator